MLQVIDYIIFPLSIMPFHFRFNLAEKNISSDAEFFIVNIFGQELMRGPAKKYNRVLVKDFNSGVYILSIRERGNISFLQKFIKNN